MNLLKFIIKYIKNKLLKFKTMCDKCSGNCNCSTGIPRGPRGLTGGTGNTGASGTATAGTTTTGLPGTEALVTDGGTPSARIFNFTIPRGDEGPPGEDGTNGTNGTSSVERFSPDVYTSGSEGNDEINFTLPVITMGYLDGYIAKFEFYCSSEDKTGYFGGATMRLYDGVSHYNLFSILSESSDLDAALIKYDVNPTTGPDSGYPSVEAINFLSGDISVEQTSPTTLTITGIVYGENIERQDDFGGAKFVQKSWRIYKEITVPADGTVSVKIETFSTINGFSAKAFNLLKYLTPFTP